MQVKRRGPEEREIRRWACYFQVAIGAGAADAGLPGEIPAAYQ